MTLPPPWVLESFIIHNLLINVFITFIILGLANSNRSFARLLQKHRKKLFQEKRLPSTWEDLQTVPEKFTKTNSGEEFLVYNEVLNKDGQCVLGFMSPSLLAVIKTGDEWSVDGTFDITKWTLFAQVRFKMIFQFNFNIFQYFFK